MSTIREHVDIPLAAGFPFPTPAWAASADQFYHRLYITRDDSWTDWKTRPVVIFFHGSGSNVAPQAENSWFVRQILAKGYVWIDSMALDAQGSSGIRPWKYPYGTLASLNLNLSGINLAWWVRSTMESAVVKGLSNKIVLMGHSMGGGAVMPYLAGRTGPKSNQVVGSIVNSHMTAADGRGGFHDGTRTLRYNNALLAETDSKLLVVAGGADSYCPSAYMRRLQVSLKTTSPVYVMVGHRTGDHGWWASSAKGQKMVQWCQQLIEGTSITDINGNPAQAGPVAPAPPLPPPPIDPVTGGVTSFKGRDGAVVPQAGDYAVADITGLTAALAGKASATHSHGISDVSGLAQALADKAPVSHSHTVAQVTGLQAALDGKAAVGTSYTKAQSDSSLAAKQDKLDFVAGQTSTFLARDGSWRTPTGGGGGGGHTGVASFNGRADDVLPEAGDYSVAQVTGLQAALDGKAGTSHAHSIAQVTGLQDKLDALETDVGTLGTAKADASSVYTKAAVDTALAGKAPTTHSHTVAQVTGLQAALDGKAPASHTHTVAQVTGLQDALDAKAASAHTHTTAQITGLDDALAGKLDKPAGTSLQYLRGNGTLATFDAASQGVKHTVSSTLMQDTPLEAASTYHTGHIASRLQGQINSVRDRLVSYPKSVTQTVVGSMVFATSAETLAYGSGFFASASSPLKPATVSATGAVTTEGDITAGTWRCLGAAKPGQATLWIRVA